MILLFFYIIELELYEYKAYTFENKCIKMLFLNQKNMSCLKSLVLVSFILIGSSLFSQAPGGVSINNEFWVKADKDVIHTSDNVEKWSDQSTSGNDATQTNNWYKPMLSLNALNYNPSIYFDGSNDYLAVNNLIASGSKSVHVFAVGTNESGGDSWHSMVLGQSNNGWKNGGYGITALTSSSEDFGFWVHDYDSYSRSFSWRNEAFEVIEGRYNGSAVSLFVSSESKGETAYAGTVGDNGSTYLGGGKFISYNHKGYIAEVAIYSSALSDNNRYKVNSYFGIKYSLTQDRTGIGENYLNSSGNSIFSSDGSDEYWNNIIGIARDDNSGLVQKQSKSRDDTTRLYLSNLASDNSSNTGSFSSDNQFIVMGANTDEMYSTGSREYPSGLGIYSRLSREWKITNTNFNGTFSMDMKLNTTPVNTDHLRLLVGSSSDLSSGATLVSPTMSISGSVLTISNLSTSDIPQNSTRYFTIVSLNSKTPLPISLLAFEALAKSSVVELTWTTATEVNNDYFELQRSQDANRWESIKIVDGKGNSSDLHTYKEVDDKPYLGTSYYRLKQVDFDGTFTYSEIRSVKFLENKRIEIYPNPAQDIVNIWSSGSFERVRLLDVSGRILLDQKANSEGEFELDLKSFGKGLYFVEVDDQKVKLIIE